MKPNFLTTVKAFRPSAVMEASSRPRPKSTSQVLLRIGEQIHHVDKPHLSGQIRSVCAFGYTIRCADGRLANIAARKARRGSYANVLASRNNAAKAVAAKKKVDDTVYTPDEIRMALMLDLTPKQVRKERESMGAKR